MTCDEMSTLTRALTRPLQLTVETSGAFATLAVVTRAMFLSRLFTDAKATRPSKAAPPTAIATLIRVVTVRLPSDRGRLIPLLVTGFEGRKFPPPRVGGASKMADRGGFEPPVRI